MCLLCFLKDSYQKKLRHRAQIKTDRFEHTLQDYQKLFISEYINFKDKELCEKAKENISPEDIHELNSVLNILKEIPIQKINDTFINLHNTYISWIDSNTLDALDFFVQILDNYSILKFTIKIDHFIMYRARKSDTFISHWDMFHVPFNKRFLISNSRYSLVGQPMLYLAFSPYTALEELGIDSSTFKISSFRVKETEKLNKIFNFTNYFSRLLNKEETVMNYADAMFIDSTIPNPEIIENQLIKTVILSCCSFKRRAEHKSSNFCEEYVLPQLLAQICKYNEFNGILYSSTKIDTVLNDTHAINILGDNVAIFTEYNMQLSQDPTYVYDKPLYNKFIISTPLSNKTEFELEINKAHELIDWVLDIISLLDENVRKMLLSSISDMFEILDYNLGKEKYLNTMAGRLHFTFLHNILLNIYNDIRFKQI